MSSTITADAPISETERPAKRLRAVLAANATTSLVTGIVALAAGSSLSDELGVPGTAWIRIVGAGLIVFAVEVGLVARRARAHLGVSAVAISIADLLWIAGTMIVLVTVDLTTAGRVVAIVLGAGVLDFALMQLWFRSRLAD